VSVNLLDGAAETSISKVEVVDVGVRPILRGSVVHDFLKSRVDDINLGSTGELSHVRRVLGDNVTHHAEEFGVLLLLIFLVHAARGNMLQVLKPLEVRAGNTTSVGEHVGDNNTTLGEEDLLSHESGRSVSTFKDDLSFDLVSIVLVDGLLFGGGDKDIARFGHEESGVRSLNFVSMAVVSESAVSHHFSFDIIGVKSTFVVDGRVVLTDSDNDTTVFVDELSSPVADSAESLDDESLAVETLCSHLCGFDKRVNAHKFLDAVVDTKSSALSTSADTALVDELTSGASFSVDVSLTVHLDVGILDPSHDLLVGSHVGSEAINAGSNKALFGELHGVTTSDLFEFVLGVELGVNAHSTFSSSERNISDTSLYVMRVARAMVSWRSIPAA